MFLELLLLCVALLVWRALWFREHYDLHKLPSPKGLPLLGHALDFAERTRHKDYSQLQERWFQECNCPDLLTINIFGHHMVYVRDLDFIQTTLLSRTDPLPKAPGLGLFKAENFQIWTGADAFLYVRALRRVYVAAFQPRALRLSFSALDAVIEQCFGLVEAKRPHGPMDFQDLVVKMTLDVIGRVALETNLGGMDGSRDLMKLMTQAKQFGKVKSSHPLKRLQCEVYPQSRAVREKHAISERLVTEWESLGEEIMSRPIKPESREKFWSLLRCMTDPRTGERISLLDLKAELAGAVIAGTDTTGHQLAWLLAAIVGHPNVKNRLLHELKECGLYGPNARRLTFEDLISLPYLNAIIKEGLRTCGVMSGIAPRVAKADMTVLGYRIPQGTWLTVPGNRCTDSAKVWGDRHVFRPERWVNEEEISDKYFSAFSMGARSCVGKQLAMTLMRTAIIRFMQRYDLTMEVPFHELMQKSRNGMVIEAEDGIWMQPRPKLFSAECRHSLSWG